MTTATTKETLVLVDQTERALILEIRREEGRAKNYDRLASKARQRCALRGEELRRYRATGVGPSRKAFGAMLSQMRRLVIGDAPSRERA